MSIRREILTALLVTGIVVGIARPAYAGCGGGMCGKVTSAKIIEVNGQETVYEIHGTFAWPGWALPIESGPKVGFLKISCTNPDLQHMKDDCVATAKLLVAAANQSWGVTFCTYPTEPKLALNAPDALAPFVTDNVVAGHMLGLDTDEVACGAVVGATPYKETPGDATVTDSDVALGTDTPSGADANTLSDTTPGPDTGAPPDPPDTTQTVSDISSADAAPSTDATRDALNSDTQAFGERRDGCQQGTTPTLPAWSMVLLLLALLAWRRLRLGARDQHPPA